MSAAPGTTQAPQVAPARLLVTLGGAGALAGALLVVAFQATQPAILANRARELALAINEVLASPPRYDTLYVVAGALTRSPPAGTDPRTLERVYLGHHDDGSPAGFAVVTGAPGFQDRIELIFGYDAARGRLLGMKVLQSSETPGLGDRILHDSAFIAGFRGVAAPPRGVRQGAGSGDSTEVDMITGATISSRAVIKAIDDALARLRPLMDGYRPEAARP